MSTLREVAGTIVEPFSVVEAKEHLRVTHTEEDEYILTLISASRKYVENELNQTMRSASYNYYLNEFPNGNIELPRPPLLSVTSVKYYDTDNVQQTLVADTDYRVDINSLPGIVEVIGSWPGTYDRTSAVDILFTAGFSDFGNIEALVLHCMKLRLTLLYDKREGGDSKEEEVLNKLLNKLKQPSF